MDKKSKEEKGKDLPAVSQGIDIFQRFDALDDKIIIDELENRVIDKWVYHFKPKDAPEVWGLGKAGIDGCARELSKEGIALREEDVKVQVDPTNAQYVLFTARVAKHFVDKQGEEAMVESAIGTKRQWTKMELKSGKVITDPFWYEKGSIKALRNAKARLIPEELKAQIIAFAKKEGKVKEVKDNGAPSQKKQTLKSKRVEGKLATAEQTLKIAKLENILVDKYGDDPGDLISKMKNEIGADAELNNITGAEADVWTKLLETRINNKERKEAERIARETAK